MSEPSTARLPLWFCYECHAEMRPLMIPDPHCASCNGTFLEEMDATGEDDPRQLAAENEQTQAILNLLNHGFPGGGGLQIPLGSRGGSRSYTNPTSGSRPSRTTIPSIANGGTIRIDMRSGPNGRNWTFQGESGSGGGQPSVFPPGLPSLPDFVQNRRGSAPTSPIDDEIETPYGPRSRRYRGPPPPLSDDPRTLLMHYFAAMLAGNPGLMFDELDGPIQGSGAFGDYVFNQEGLDRIITQLMETAGQSKPNPAPEDMIANLKRTELTYTSDLVKAGQSCAICTEYFAPLDPGLANQPPSIPQPDENTSPGSGFAITLPCAHSFHDDCIITWLRTSGTCPVCRYALVEQPRTAGSGGVPNPPPGAASTSTSNPPRISNPLPNFHLPANRVETRPQGDRTSSSRSAASNNTNPPSSPQGQADTFFSQVGGPGALLESLFGLIGGHNGRGEEQGNGSSSTRPEPSPASASQPQPPPAPGQSSAGSGQNGERTTSPRPSSPPRFFRDRGQGGASSSRPGQDARRTSNWDDVD